MCGEMTHSIRIFESTDFRTPHMIYTVFLSQTYVRIGALIKNITISRVYSTCAHSFNNLVASRFRRWSIGLETITHS